jgi:hypothetical protein
MVVPTFQAGDDVVGLQPIAALTAIDHTTPVSGQHMATEPGGEVGEGLSYRHQVAPVGDGVDLDLPGAEQQVQGLGTHPGTGEHGKTGLSRLTTIGEVGAVEGHGQERLGTSSVLPPRSESRCKSR